MANNYGANQTIQGYITNLSNENKKKKFFVKFTMLSENNQTIDGWIFSTGSGILNTQLGISLSNSFKNKIGIKLWGSLDDTNGSMVFRMQAWGRYQTTNLNFQLPTPSNDVLSIKDALMSIESNTIRVSIIDIRPSETFNSQGVIRTSNFVLIGDQTSTTYLLVTDLLAEILKVEETYDITKVRKRIINGSCILSSTIDTHISLSSLKVTPDLDNITETMNINLIDIQKITSKIIEVGEIHRIWHCTTCNNDLIEVQGAAALLFCEKCHRHILKQNVIQDNSTSIVIKSDEDNILLLVNNQFFHKLLQLIGLNVNMSNNDICIRLMSEDNFIFTYSQLRKELIDVTKEE